ncbi:penicillin-binding protein activator [Methylobacterium isbiliense]|jgi:ABC-type branched-subunit amino acid transport system substrate-binding protein|uniref:Penicillin-binding protein activator LpoA n=1 Tax=Methylobacterium isbiliense TaxID=315478 RepID=A0ABQ4SCJ6_9HYPH|nr:penicillin-binding protein activator [Methylobacterium isbiliense]MDN3623326.1 penicillin-binding protein activator [Methylobacterium isbiliense]GJE00118.1 Penicillin-binding protein activator LpoA [Methylobacterium isbiliense]
MAGLRSGGVTAALRGGVRRLAPVLVPVLALAFGLGACGGMESPVMATRPVAEAPPAPGLADGTGIGAGSVKVALILPLTGPGAAAGAAMRNAAQLAVQEFQNPDLRLVVKDDRGSPEGAREAAAAALAEGAELVIGPLFAGSVQAAAATLRPAGKPVIAFSTDASVAARGVYLLSFLPQPEVDRVVDEVTSAGRRSFAALIPDTTYGNAVEAQFREAVARRGGRLVALERYPAGNPGPAVARLGPLIAGPGAQADVLFLPDTPEGLGAAAGALTRAGFNPARVKPVGTALWNDPRVFALPALQGGWFAAVDPAGYASFAQRYRARFGSDPVRVASLAYDAVSLAAALNRQYGSQRFAETTLTNPSGFAGIDGTFRFRPEGLSDRALAVFEIRGTAAAVVSPAPRALGPSGT